WLVRSPSTGPLRPSRCGGVRAAAAPCPRTGTATSPSCSSPPGSPGPRSNTGSPRWSPGCRPVTPAGSAAHGAATRPCWPGAGSCRPRCSTAGWSRPASAGCPTWRPGGAPARRPTVPSGSPPGCGTCRAGCWTMCWCTSSPTWWSPVTGRTSGTSSPAIPGPSAPGVTWRGSPRPPSWTVPTMTRCPRPRSTRARWRS
ncbi:MAG: Zinc metalloprotease, partial [uncultured Corynebacteriales bacterium]